MNEFSIIVPDFAVRKSQPTVQGREFAIILVTSLFWPVRWINRSCYPSKIAANDAGDMNVRGPFFFSSPLPSTAGGPSSSWGKWNSLCTLPNSLSSSPWLSQERQENTLGIIKFFRGPRKQTLIAPSAIFSPSSIFALSQCCFSDVRVREKIFVILIMRRLRSRILASYN